MFSGSPFKSPWDNFLAFVLGFFPVGKEGSGTISLLPSSPLMKYPTQRRSATQKGKLLGVNILWLQLLPPNTDPA